MAARLIVIPLVAEQKTLQCQAQPIQQKWSPNSAVEYLNKQPLIQISRTNNPKMPANTSNDRVFTTSYSYGSDDKEYLFSCKGRPFIALVSPNLPMPSSSMIDYT